MEGSGLPPLPSTYAYLKHVRIALVGVATADISKAKEIIYLSGIALVISWCLVTWSPNRTIFNSIGVNTIDYLYWICLIIAMMLSGVGFTNILGIICYDLGSQSVLWGSLSLIAVAFGLYKFGRDSRRMSRAFA